MGVGQSPFSLGVCRVSVNVEPGAVVQRETVAAFTGHSVNLSQCPWLRDRITVRRHEMPGFADAAKVG